jgi:hypothetical protein
MGLRGVNQVSNVRSDAGFRAVGLADIGVTKF